MAEPSLDVYQKSFALGKFSVLELCNVLKRLMSNFQIVLRLLTHFVTAVLFHIKRENC